VDEGLVKIDKHLQVLQVHQSPQSCPTNIGIQIISFQNIEIYCKWPSDDESKVVTRENKAMYSLTNYSIRKALVNIFELKIQLGLKIEIVVLLACLVLLLENEVYILV